MRTNALIITTILISAAALASILNANAKATKTLKLRQKEVPQLQLDGDSTITIHSEWDVQVPKGYVGTRQRVVLRPVLRDLNGTQLYEGSPLVVDGPIMTKKLLRSAVLEKKIDPLAPYVVPVAHPTGAFVLKVAADSEPIVIPAATQLSADERNVDAPVAVARMILEVTSDGCGKCTGRDELLLANICVPPVPLEEPLGLQWMPVPQYKARPKIFEGSGEARLQFIVSKHDIRPDLADNRRELNRMISDLTPVLKDSLATLTKLEIAGTASVDGPLSFNIPLALRRANAAKDWLAANLALTPAQLAAVITMSEALGWQPILDTMKAEKDPAAETVAAIVAKYPADNDDLAEAAVKKQQPAAWSRIRNDYAIRDRRVNYRYAYTIRSFTTDEELLQMWTTRPDAFSEEEMLRVAELQPTPEKKIEVYAEALRRNPDKQILRNNLAVLLWEAGRHDDARAVRDGANLINDKINTENR